jgi:hypothetical protein
VAKGFHGIDAGSPARGRKSSEQRDGDEHNHSEHQGQWLFGRSPLIKTPGSRPDATASGAPINSPKQTIRTASRITIPATACCVAPSAIRTPISFTRRPTENATSP